MNLKKYISTILFVSIVVGLATIISSGLNYINELEEQIIERDKLISRLAVSDALVREYFDIKQDSLTNEIVYTLKPSKKEQVQIVERIIDGFGMGETIITPEEMRIKYNSIAKDYTKLVSKYNQLVGEYNEVVEHMAYNDALKAALDLIYKNYGLKCNIKKDSSMYIISLPEFSKVDSALILLPYFRENLHFDDKSGKWIITRSIVEKNR